MFRHSAICLSLITIVFWTAPDISAGFPPTTGGEFRVTVESSAPFVFGPDPDGAVEFVDLTGTFLVREWPFPGYAKTVLPDGREQIEMDLLEAHLEGYSPALEGMVKKDHGAALSTGTITQITPGVDFPAELRITRNVFIQTPLGTVANAIPIEIEATIDRIPPIFDPAHPEFNVFRGTHPRIPLQEPACLADPDCHEVLGYIVASDNVTILTGVIQQGCCWRCVGSQYQCAAPVLQADCPEGWSWVASQNCGTAACGYPCQAVPALSAWGLVVLTLSCLVLGTIMSRERWRLSTDA